jgi:hypothetical protein
LDESNNPERPRDINRFQCKSLGVLQNECF